MATDNAKAIEQLKASQEQMARLVAKPSEAKPLEPRLSGQDARAKTPAPLPRPAANAAHKPPSQARANPQPIQLQPKEQ